MALDDLLAMMERRYLDTPDTLRNPLAVSVKPAPIQACTSDTPDTPQNGQAKREEGKGGAPIIAATSHWWRFHYAQGDSKEASYSPAATHADAMAGELDAIKAESFEPLLRQPRAPLSQEEKTTLLDWLERINETDEAMISAMLHQCQIDQDAREAFLRMAKKAVMKGDCRIDQNQTD